MAHANRSSELVRFDAYEVDLRARELYKEGRKIKLQDQPFQVLASLLERPGDVVTRDELQKKLWPADTFVDFDHSLNTAIKKLRLALGDDNKKPRFVETLPKRGYRFIGTVKQPAESMESATTPHRSSSLSSSSPAVQRSSWVGSVAKITCGSEASLVLLCTDAESAREREKLDAANDDVGLSLLIASQKVLMVRIGTPVRILEVHEMPLRCQVRILEGEHYGETALVPVELLAGLT